MVRKETKKCTKPTSPAFVLAQGGSKLLKELYALVSSSCLDGMYLRVRTSTAQPYNIEPLQ